MNGIFDEYDAVVAQVDLSQNVKEGTLGAVLLVLDEANGIYEVEFVDQFGVTLDVMTVNKASIRHA
jgi:hypothetical protein